MNRIATCMVALLCAALVWQERHISRQTRTMEAQGRELAEVKVANSGLALALSQVEAARARDNQRIAEHARQLDRATASSRILQRQLQEALRHDRPFDLDTPLPRAVTRSFCLRYRAAAGAADPGSAGDSASGAPSGARHSFAAVCGGWERLTLRQALEWVGLLLDHAGRERLDKAALRQWAEEHQREEKP